MHVFIWLHRLSAPPASAPALYQRINCDTTPSSEMIFPRLRCATEIQSLYSGNKSSLFHSVFVAKLFTWGTAKSLAAAAAAAAARGPMEIDFQISQSMRTHTHTGKNNVERRSWSGASPLDMLSHASS